MNAIMNIKTLILQHLRAKKQLLILALGAETQLSLWKQQECLWQETQDDRELEAWLRDVLLAHDVEEGIAILILLDDSLLQSEQLTLPKLPAKQLKKTLAWEAAQLFNLPHGSYSFCYKILSDSASKNQGEQDKLTTRQTLWRHDEKEQEGQQVVQLWALAYARQAEYVALAQRLMVKLEGVCVGIAANQVQSRQLDTGEEEPYDDSTLVAMQVQSRQLEASKEEARGESTLAASIAQSWFAGEELLLLPSVPRRIDWKHGYALGEQYLPHAAKAMLACAWLTFAVSFAGHYLAQADLKAVQQETERYAVWQQRQQESSALEKRLAKLRQQAGQRKKQTLASKELESWGRLGLTNIYLTALEYKSSAKQGRLQSVIMAQGLAADGAALDELIDKLQAGKQYSSVQLVESQQQAGGVSFRLQLASAQETAGAVNIKK